MEADLAFITDHFKFSPDTIVALERQGVPLLESLDLLDKVKECVCNLCVCNCVNFCVFLVNKTCFHFCVFNLIYFYSFLLILIFC